jgi:uncharacterized glyoxalase superfamily protein PhnB
MLSNRSIPDCSVIPELPYKDAREAAAWLNRAFGFQERLRIGNHRVQLVYGNGAIVATDRAQAGSSPQHAVLVRVADAQAHCAQARQAGARILSPPTDQPYGERQYSAQDLGGHVWTFTQTLTDVDPALWGGELLT